MLPSVSNYSFSCSMRVLKLCCAFPTAIVLLIFCQVFISSVEGRYTIKSSFLRQVDSAVDQILEKLYGDIEPKRELFGEPRHSSHTGDDNALHYTNEWVVHVPQGEAEATRLALNSGYEYLGEVKGFPGVYHMRKPDHPEAHKRNARELTNQLISDKSVRWADQQYAKYRTKREFNFMDLVKFVKGNNVEENSAHDMNRPYPVLSRTQESFDDPLWEKEWYMQDTRTKKSLPRLDLNVLPVFDMGYTGKGINVVILDDGLERNHTDLVSNYNPQISGDLNDNDDDPMPNYTSGANNAHGTRCAGEVAMKANNSKCGVGIAHGARIGGVRMLDGPVSDRVEGQALSFALDLVDIFSASWGPNDDGETVEGPGRLAQIAMAKGVTEGRNGKGVIYVWASGNGGAKGDSCACDGYASNIYTLSIGSASESGSFPWYGEKCPSTMAVTYSSGAYTDQKIATTDWRNDCTTSHTGTSASAPLAAGIVALTLEANSKLTWRDVQHLVVWTSQPRPLIDNPGWKVNKAGFKFNSRFGFGLMDTYEMVSTALNWVNVPPQKICRVKSLPLSDKVIDPLKPKIVEFISDACRGTENEINFLEHVEVITSVQFSTRGSLQIDLTSPQGTRTRILFPRIRDASSTGYAAWPFVSVHTWGEDPFGNWTFNLTDATRSIENRGAVEDVELVFYGTKDPPAKMLSGPRVYPEEYNKKSLVTSSNVSTQPIDRLRAILDDLDNWVIERP